MPRLLTAVQTHWPEIRCVMQPGLLQIVTLQSASNLATAAKVQHNTLYIMIPVPTVMTIMTGILLKAGTHCSLWHRRAPPSTSTASSPLPRGLLRQACQSCLCCSSTPQFASTPAGALCTQHGTSSECSTSSRTLWRWRSCQSTTPHQACLLQHPSACMTRPCLR